MPNLESTDSPSAPPQPAAFEVLQGAVVVAGINLESAVQTNKPTAPFVNIGVRRADDSVALFGGDVFRHRWSLPAQISQLQGPIDHHTGRAFYGGVAGPIFGHLITQSLGRLWAAPAGVPIFFIADSQGFNQLPAYFIQLIRRMGVDNPIQLITRSCRVDELIVAQDMYNLERPKRITAKYNAWLVQARGDMPLQEDLFLYISRAGLGPDQGQYLQEAALQAALCEQGYRVIYPELMSIDDQIDLYLRAKRLIFADGSAVHLWSLFASAEQMAAVVCRRKPQPKMMAMLAGMKQANAQFFDCRLAEFSGNGRGANSIAALLDMDQLWRRLRRRGFHSKRHLYFPARTQLIDWLAGLQSGQTAPPPFDLDAASAAILAKRPKVKVIAQAT